MSLGLSHSLSRYKLKFSPDKVSAPTGLPPSASALVSLVDGCEVWLLRHKLMFSLGARPASPCLAG